jgi:hypothetical protein
MTHNEEKAKRKLWRPRFGLRTLALFVMLVCAYFAAWEATKRYGVRAVMAHDATLVVILVPDIERHHVHSSVPFLVVAGVTDSYTDPTSGVSRDTPMIRRYYLWFGRIFLVREWWNPRIQRGLPDVA